VPDAADVEACHATLALDDTFKETGTEFREPGVEAASDSWKQGRLQRACFVLDGYEHHRAASEARTRRHVKERKATAALWKERWDRCGGYDF
tara:strand:- start:355 stop:630 length:276 start_codon:yes stop_codon:yes gene_type:complete